MKVTNEFDGMRKLLAAQNDLILYYQEQIETLKAQIQNLEEERDTAQHYLELAERRYLRESVDTEGAMQWDDSDYR